MFRSFWSVLLACAASSAFADDALPIHGVAAPSGSVFTTSITAGDSDDYQVTAFAGSRLVATVRPSRGSELTPLIEILGPDGAAVTEDDGLVLSGPRRARAARLRVDASGVWTVRVRGENATTGDYSVALDVTPPARTARLEAPLTELGKVAFVIPGGPRATIGWKLTAKSGTSAFHSFRDPSGTDVAGVPGTTSLRGFRLAPDAPLGDYTLTFDVAGGGPFVLTRTLVPPRPAKRRVARLATNEPVIVDGSIAPATASPGVRIAVRALGLADPYAKHGSPSVAVGGTALTDVVLDPDGQTLHGTIPSSVVPAVHDVVVRSNSGQPAVARLALEVVPRPVVTSATPLEAPSFGEVDVTFTGTGFRPHIGLVIGGVLTAVQPAEVTPTSVRFPMPPHAVGLFSIGVRDLDTGVEALLGSAQFEYLVAPLITAVQPAAVPLLSEETITLEGGVYAADDKVWLELADGSFEEITATQTTYVDDRHHRFAAPLRSKGAYRVYVQSSDGNPNPPRTKLLTYFTFVDATAASGLEAGDDNWDAASSALADLDGDDRPELILSRRGGATATTSSQTRVLANDGSGELTDATAAVMPAVTDDDWRADRVVAADIDGDGRADLVLTTNSLTVPPAGRSHTRILMNEAKGGAGADAADRVLRDRTLDLMPAVRTMKKFGAWGGSNETYVSDDWRGLDLWVGDLDASGGRPSIVLTHDEVKNDDNPGSGGFTGGVYCGTYCATPYSSSYPYTFYWGGSRAFVWDKFARGGLGRFRFDANFFPRKSAITIPVGSGPGGIDYPLCSASYAAACKLLFTPFAGQRVAVRDLDADGRPDVAVASNQAVQRRFTRNGPMSTISSLQVGLRGFNAADGALITDVTSKLTALGLDLTGDALAIGRTGYPDGNAFGTIALTKTQALSGSALRMLRFSSPGGVLTVSDETTAERPAPGVDDAFQASALRFTDFDSDGDEDLVLLASSAPGGTQSAFRILRNEADGATKGVYRRACDDLLASLAGPADRLDGAALAIGDLSGDGLPDFLISRPAPSNATTDTRTLRMDK